MSDYESIEWTRIFQGNHNNFTVDKFSQTNSLRPYCSDISLYECFEADLVKSKHCGGLCEVVTLPNDILPKCSSAEQYDCSKEIFTKTIMDENHTCRKEKSCTDLTYGLKEVREASDEDYERVYFEYSLGIQMSSEGIRYHAPYKIVHTEYLVWTDISLVANIGGTLGLTIGQYFSANLKHTFTLKHSFPIVFQLL